MVFHNNVNKIIEFLSNFNTPCFIFDEQKSVVWLNESASHTFPNLTVGATDSFLLQEGEDALVFNRLKKNLPVQLERDVYPLTESLLSFFPIAQDPLLTVAIFSKRISTPENHDTPRVLDAFSNAYKTNITSNDSIYSYIFKQLNDKDDYEVSKYLQILVRNNYKMLRDTNNIVTMTRLLNNSFQLKTVYSDIVKFLKTSLDAIKLLVDPTDIPFSFSLPENPVFTRFDPDQLNAVLTNLISNAYIFTRDYNKVDVKVSVLDKNLVIRVSDKGLGIKEEHLPYVNRPYFSHNEITRIGGVGAGLFIVSEVVKAHDGTMLLQSEYGEGTNVTVSVPITAPEDEPTVLNSKTSDYIKNKFSPLYVGLCAVCFFPYP